MITGDSLILNRIAANGQLCRPRLPGHPPIEKIIAACVEIGMRLSHDQTNSSCMPVQISHAHQLSSRNSDDLKNSQKNKTLSI
jgi:hypothetical protein